MEKMQDSGRFTIYKDGHWRIWIEEETYRTNIYLQRSCYFNLEFVDSITRRPEDAEKIVAALPDSELLRSAKEQYKSKWLDDDDEI